MSPHLRLHTPRLKLEAVLARPEMAGLSPDERAETLGLLLIELEKRVGLELMPVLDPDSRRHFTVLMERGADSDELTAFFSVRIPDYRERVESVMDSFCGECSDAFDRLSSETI